MQWLSNEMTSRSKMTETLDDICGKLRDIDIEANRRDNSSSLVQSKVFELEEGVMAFQNQMADEMNAMRQVGSHLAEKQAVQAAHLEEARSPLSIENQDAFALSSASEHPAPATALSALREDLVPWVERLQNAQHKMELRLDQLYRQENARAAPITSRTRADTVPVGDGDALMTMLRPLEPTVVMTEGSGTDERLEALEQILEGLVRRQDGLEQWTEDLGLKIDEAETSSLWERLVAVEDRTCLEGSSAMESLKAALLQWEEKQDHCSAASRQKYPKGDLARRTRQSLAESGAGRTETLVGVIASQVSGVAECHTVIGETKEVVQAILEEVTNVKSELGMLGHGLREVQVSKASITSTQAGMDDVMAEMDRLTGEIEHLKREAKVYAPGVTLTNINGWEETEIEARLELLKGVVTDHVINLHASLGKVEDGFDAKLKSVKCKMQVIEGTNAMMSLRRIFSEFTVSGTLARRFSIWRFQMERARVADKITENRQKITSNSLRLSNLEANIRGAVLPTTSHPSEPSAAAVSDDISAELVRLESQLEKVSSRVQGVIQNVTGLEAGFESEHSLLERRVFEIENGIVREQVALQTKLTKHVEEIDNLRQQMRQQGPTVGATGESDGAIQDADGLAIKLQDFWTSEYEAMRNDVTKELSKVKEGLSELAGKADERSNTLTEGLVRHERKMVRRIDHVEEALKKASQGLLTWRRAQGLAKMRRALLANGRSDEVLWPDVSSFGCRPHWRSCEGKRRASRDSYANEFTRFFRGDD